MTSDSAPNVKLLPTKRIECGGPAAGKRGGGENGSDHVDVKLLCGSAGAASVATETAKTAMNA